MFLKDDFDFFLVIADIISFWLWQIMMIEN